MIYFKTEQEAFWAGQFGTEYIGRNTSKEFIASNLNLFTKALNRVGKPESLIEFGANVGMNLLAIKLLFPSIKLHGIEINEKAAEELSIHIGKENVLNSSILDYSINEQFDVTLIKGVLIHINPYMLPLVYQKLYEASKKYILVCEYYNPTPVSVSYTGHQDRLFKRDFAGELLGMYNDLTLVDYGFVYKRDIAFPADDITWFLLKKRS